MTFFRITDIPYVGNKMISSITAIWTVPGFTNRQKSVIFKYFNNILGLNTGTSHFAANATRVCTFCAKKNPPEVNDETFLHLFHTCSTTRIWQQQFIARCFPEMGNFDTLEEKKLWMLGIFQDSRHSAPLPVTTAATAQHTRSTANAAISGVLQQAITPRQAIAPR